MKSLPSYGSDPQAFVGNVGRLLADVMASVDQAIGRAAKPFGITGPQWIVLMRIANGSGTTAAELCRSLRYDSGSMTRMLDRLSFAGLVKRERDPEDRRVVRLQLTPKGEELLGKVEPIGFAVMEHHLSGLSHQDVEQLTSILSRMLNTASLS